MTKIKIEDLDGIAAAIQNCSTNGGTSMVSKHRMDAVQSEDAGNAATGSVPNHHDSKCLEIKKEGKERVLRAPPMEKLHPELPESMGDVEQMTEILAANNLMAKLNAKLTQQDGPKAVEMDWDGLEEEVLKSKLSKFQAETAKYKGLVKQYAGLLRPKEMECQQLKKENGILQQKIETLNSNFTRQIERLNNMLKNETENVKEERYKSLRQDKYVQRLQRKYDFVCTEYNIDPDVVVIQMGAKQCS